MGYGNTPEYKRAYYLANREKILAQVQANREANLERIAAYRAGNYQRIAARGMVAKARKRATEKGIPFDESYMTVRNIQNMLANPHCRACEVRFDQTHTGKAGPRDNSATLDRVTNELGYVFRNVQLLCFSCNKAKGVLTLERMKMLVAWWEEQLAR